MASSVTRGTCSCASQDVFMKLSVKERQGTHKLVHTSTRDVLVAPEGVNIIQRSWIEDVIWLALYLINIQYTFYFQFRYNVCILYIPIELWLKMPF